MCITCHRSAHRQARDAPRQRIQLPRTIAAHIPYQSVCDTRTIRSDQMDVVGRILPVGVEPGERRSICIRSEVPGPHLDACSRILG